MEDNAANEVIASDTLSSFAIVADLADDEPRRPNSIIKIERPEFQSLCGTEDDSLVESGRGEDISRLPSVALSSPDAAVSFIVDVENGGHPREHQTLRKQSSVSFGTD